MVVVVVAVVLVGVVAAQAAAALTSLIIIFRPMVVVPIAAPKGIFQITATKLMPPTPTFKASAPIADIFSFPDNVGQ